MVSIDDAVLARYSHGGKHFEIYVDSTKALDLKEGKAVPISEVLAVEDIFKDAKKGDRAAESSLEESFGTSVVAEVAKKIIKNGEIQLTTEQRRQRVEQKKKAVIAAIAREAYNPQTKTPHTPQRIEQAMTEAHVHVDAFESVNSQVPKVVKAIMTLLPISMERLKIEVLVPPTHTGKVYGSLRKHELENEEWLPDGHLRAVVVIPAGLEDDFYDEINNMTKGETQFKRLNNS